MAAGTFTLTEIRATADPSGADEGERFEWTADSTAATLFDGTRGGGARACPVKPWEVGGEQRTVRTDYPGSKIPSEQVLGPVHKQHTFKGRWDDRYNGAGYAVFEQRRFVAMCERGNLVRWQYGAFVYEGIIKTWDCPIQREWYINYSFTTSTHRRIDQALEPRAPATPLDPTKQLDRFDVAVQAMLDADERAPRHFVGGTLADDVTTQLVAQVNVREGLAQTIDNRDVLPTQQPVDSFARIASQFRSAKAAGVAMLDRLVEVRADLDMVQNTAVDLLNFEDWVRSVRYMTRLVLGTAIVGDRAASEHTAPAPTRLYRPQQGEHLYSVSRKFYGTPHAWRLIAERNRLDTYIMDGVRVLVIPERGGVA